MEKQDFIKWAQKLQASYVPNEAVQRQIQSVDLIAIVGPTGVGKSTIIDRLGIPHVLSDVTRQPRPDEKQGRNYFFRSDYMQIIKEIKAGEFVQFLISSSGEFYGTRAQAYPQDGFCTMAIYANAIPHFRELGFRSVKPIYIMPPSYVEWMRRIGGVRTKDILARIHEARESVNLALLDSSYNFVLNDTLDIAVSEVKDIMMGNPVNEHRAQLARDTADIILERIGDTELLE